jgi:RNA polymerase sigma-70 factor (ECF subfamily)
MTAYQKGELGAFAELVQRHEKPLWNFLRRFVADDATAQDLLQETFERVIKARAQWRPDAKFSTWLYTIAHHLCIDHSRRAKHRRALSLDGESRARDSEPEARLLDALPGRDQGAEHNAIERQLLDRVEAAIAQLPEPQREVFLMREVLGLPFAEIASAVDTSEPTVKSRMRYALEALRAALPRSADAAQHTEVEP